MTNLLDILYKTEADCDGYWISYDLKLENNWADVDVFTISWIIFGYGGSRIRNKSDSYVYYDGSRLGHYKRSSIDGILWSTAGIGYE